MSQGPPAFRIRRPAGRSPFVLACDHATNHVPADLHDLGLPRSELARHIAWDIGAAGVTEALSVLLDAPAVFSGVSRLVIDCNRQLTDPGLIPAVSAGTPVPGNAHLSHMARASRIASWFRPYHDALEAVLADRETRGMASSLISVHSMTPVLNGRFRPWKIALSSHRDRRLTDPVLAALRHHADPGGGEGPGPCVVGDNEPYDVDPDVDYTTPFHALRRGLPYLQVEFRQDEVADEAAQRAWAERLYRALPSQT